MRETSLHLSFLISKTVGLPSTGISPPQGGSPAHLHSTTQTRKPFSESHDALDCAAIVTTTGHKYVFMARTSFLKQEHTVQYILEGKRNFRATTRLRNKALQQSTFAMSNAQGK
jgi:hypothetical protein